MGKSNNNFDINISMLKFGYPHINFNDVRDSLRMRGAVVEGVEYKKNKYMRVSGISESLFNNVLMKYGLRITPGSLNENKQDRLRKIEGRIADWHKGVQNETCGCKPRRREVDEDEIYMEECGCASCNDVDDDNSINELYYKRSTRPRNVSEGKNMKSDDPISIAKDMVKNLDLPTSDKAKLTRRISAIAKAKDCNAAEDELRAFNEIARELNVKVSSITAKLKKAVKAICLETKLSSANESKANERVSNRKGNMLTEKFKAKFAKESAKKREMLEKQIFDITNNSVVRKMMSKGLCKSSKASLVYESLKKRKPSLYTSFRINGSYVSNMEPKELRMRICECAKSITAHKNKLKNNLNESESKRTNELIKNCRSAITRLLEEYEYRRLFKIFVLNEASDDADTGQVADMANMFSGDDFSDFALPGDENASDNNDPKAESTEDSKDSEGSEDKGEEVELSGIVFTMKNKTAADDLIQSCVDAGVPEDAFEFVDDENDEDDDNKDGDKDDKDDKDDKQTDDSGENEEDAEKNANEAFNAMRRRYRYLFEDDEPEGDGNDAGDGADTAEGGEESDETDDSKPVKVRLVNTDYTLDVASVLEDVYGISRDEFEEMIGGPIVEPDKNGEENGDEPKEPEPEDDDEDDSAEQLSGDEVFAGM